MFQKRPQFDFHITNKPLFLLFICGNEDASTKDDLLMITQGLYQVCRHTLLLNCASMQRLLGEKKIKVQNYSGACDYHSPVQQPCFSGALKVTRVEQMAQFPQSFRINESPLQRNANFQTLDCFLKQD